MESAVQRIYTTDSGHKHQVYPNLLKGRDVTGVNQVWVADITYIRIVTGFVYLAVTLDIFSRRVVGWALSKRIDHELTLAALKMAIASRKPSAGIIHHSDRGVQYACSEYVRELEKHGFVVSMSSAGNPYDNAFAESFMKTLKHEEVHLWEYESFTDVVERVRSSSRQFITASVCIPASATCRRRSSRLYYRTRTENRNWDRLH